MSSSGEGKNLQYEDARYTALLEAKGSFIGEAAGGISTESKDLCQRLLTSPQHLPSHSLFNDNCFGKTCDKLQGRGRARVIQDIGRLLVPSAETLSTLGQGALDDLIETVDETWDNAIPLQGPSPKPDYAVGFRRSAFTKQQLERLNPLIGTVFDMSYFVATHHTYFPFLTYEAGDLNTADRQNAHSMTLAVRGVVELFRCVDRHAELNRETLAFSISHDQKMVRLYGHYAVVSGNEVSYYRHPIHAFDFTTLEGKEKWTAYQFTRNIYDIWMPMHLERICSAIMDIPPGINFSDPSLPAVLASQPDSS